MDGYIWYIIYKQSVLIQEQIEMEFLILFGYFDIKKSTLLHKFLDWIVRGLRLESVMIQIYKTLTSCCGMGPDNVRCLHAVMT